MVTAKDKGDTTKPGLWTQ